MPFKTGVSTIAGPLHRLFKLVLSLSCLGLCVSVLCCATDPVGLDLVTYINQGILNIAQLENRALESYAAVTGENYTSEDRVYWALKDNVIPNYKLFLDLLREIDPETDEVKIMHGTYVRGAEHLYRGFRTKMLALEANDRYVMRAANEEIEKGRQETEKWRQQLVYLQEGHGVVLEKTVRPERRIFF